MKASATALYQPYAVLLIRPLQSSVVEAVWTVNQLRLPFFTPFLRARYFVQGPLGKRFRIPVASISLPAYMTMGAFLTYVITLCKRRLQFRLR